MTSGACATGAGGGIISGLRVTVGKGSANISVVDGERAEEGCGTTLAVYVVGLLNVG